MHLFYPGLPATLFAGMGWYFDLFFRSSGLGHVKLGKQGHSSFQGQLFVLSPKQLRMKMPG